MHYSRNVNMTDRNEMISFLKRHLRCNTRYLWDRSTSYANDISFEAMNIGPLKDVVEFFEEQHCGVSLTLCSGVFNIDVARDFSQNQQNSFIVEINEGHAVLYQCHLDGKGIRRALLNRGTDENETFMSWSDDQVRERVELVSAFDRACDEMRAIYIARLLSALKGFIEDENVLKEKLSF